MMISAMNLKISARKIIKWVGFAILAIIFLVFFGRVAIFEHEYYNEKEGSEREVVIQVEEEEELIEVEPTKEEVKEYIVAADRPRYLTIKKLGISNARILAVGTNANGEMATPRNIFDTGWFEGSGKPGEGKTMIIDGHNGGPHVKGVFKNLPALVAGDIITIERGDGAIYNYTVVENNQVPLDEADMYMRTAAKSPEAGKESVTLISCSGEWSQQRGTYLSRQFVRAVLVEK